MSTIIYPSPIFGPVKSRRLGVSLGINLMPADGKVCTFDCIYCECGLNGDHHAKLPRPKREEVAEALEQKLKEMRQDGELPDVLTFAGNGEPTAHPQFAGIIDDTIRLRNLYCPEAKVSVLSNATMIDRPQVFQALLKVDNNIQKLDTVDNDYIRLLDRPVSPDYDVQKVIDHLKAFNGHVIIQTMFLKGARDKEQGARGKEQGARSKEQELSTLDPRLSTLDNTGEEYIGPWLEAVREIAPQSVMIYTIDRDTPVEGLEKASREQLDAIRDRVIAAGIPCTASY